MCTSRASRSSCGAALLLLVVAVVVDFASAEEPDSKTPWKTLNGDRPIVVARGGFSGLLPDSSEDAYKLASIVSSPDVILWCDVQLTKDGVGICFPDIRLTNGSNIGEVFKKKEKVYTVNGLQVKDWFPVDFTHSELQKVTLAQRVLSRTQRFDGNSYSFLSPENLPTPPGLWLNIQHDAFYAHHNLSMRSYVLSVYKRVVVKYISSPEVNFLRSVTKRFNRNITKLVFRFMGKSDFEPTTNQTYESLLKNLTFVKTFSSGILIPKDYIWPVDASQYLLPHTSVVADAHKEGLEVFAYDFSNDVPISYNFSYDPVAEYLQFIDNGDFAVDGVLSDFPMTPYAAIDCFSHMGTNASNQVNLTIITKHGASGDYPSCTNLSYKQAILDGADFIDCPVQMSKDGIPFCSPSVNLISGTNVIRSKYSNYAMTIPELMSSSGIFALNLTWDEIRTLTPEISNPYTRYMLLRNPKFKNAGQLLTLAEFLGLAKNASTLSGVLLSIENAAYLAEKQGLGVADAVLKALKDAGYNKLTQLKVMIQSSDSSVLMKFKDNSYGTVYEIDKSIGGTDNASIGDIKNFADAVVIKKESVYSKSEDFITGTTDVVAKIHSLNLPVYVELFSNEFVSQAWDFYSDATVEINTFVSDSHTNIDGVVTDYPKTADRYRKNRCLSQNLKETPVYMSPVKPGDLTSLIFSTQYLPPAEAPNPILTESDIIEPPLPPVAKKPSSSPGNGTLSPWALPNSANGNPRLTRSMFLSSLATLLLF